MNTYLIDTTLRDGEQAPGVVFNIIEKIKVASLLDQLGVHEVEAGSPAIGAEEQQAIAAIATAGFRFKTSCWCRANLPELKIASRLATDAVNISLPVSDIQIAAIGKSREWVIAELKKVLNFAVQHFSFVTIGAQDASRADALFLEEYIHQATSWGAHRIRITDTVGILDPLATQRMFGRLTGTFNQSEFEFHGHNDLGMATANAITALQSGARCVSATVNGLGERAGNSVLEEIVAYLTRVRQQKGFNTSQVHNLSRYVAQISNRINSESKPVTGTKTFLHESGIHTAAMTESFNAYQVIDPKEFGAGDTRFVFGKHSGKKGLMHFFSSHGISLNEQEALVMLQKIKEMAQRYKTILSEAQLLEMYAHIVFPDPYNEKSYARYKASEPNCNKKEQGNLK